MITVTGFSGFPNMPVNPTGLLIEKWQAEAPAWSNTDTQFELLATEYQSAGEKVQQLVSEPGCKLLVMLGVSGVAANITLERFALNCDQAPIADASGETRSGSMINTQGATAYTTDLDLQAAQAHLKAQGIEVSISNHAGTYVCNHVYYMALHSIEQLGTSMQALFVHIPLTPKKISESHLKQGYLNELDHQFNGLFSCLKSQL